MSNDAPASLSSRYNALLYPNAEYVSYGVYAA
nr:hypothetical protein [Pseudomonas syringae]